MFGLNLERKFIAAFAAVLMSTVAVGAAVAPASVQSPAVAVHA